MEAVYTLIQMPKYAGDNKGTLPEQPRQSLSICAKTAPEF